MFFQLEHARALEIQIQQNKQRIEAEKFAEEEKERKLQLRLEEERRQLEEKFAAEKLKADAEELRKHELTMQIEEKKRQKQQEELDAKKIEEKENVRLAKEQLELARRDREEIERERASISMTKNAAPTSQALSPEKISRVNGKVDIFAPKAKEFDFEVESPGSNFSSNRNINEQIIHKPTLFSPKFPPSPKKSKFIDVDENIERINYDLVQQLQEEAMIAKAEAENAKRGFSILHFRYFFVILCL
jgi:hypothetical protein